MNDILRGNFANRASQSPFPHALKVINWNINRGLRLREVLQFLEAQSADLLILQEVDLDARRTRYMNVAEELARNLEMNYAFGFEFQELTEGSGTDPAYHGQTTLSRRNLLNVRVLRFRRQSNFWRPRWFVPNRKPFQKRLGGRIALVTDVNFSGRLLTVYNVHLESRGGDDLRQSQLDEVLGSASETAGEGVSLLAGDLNCDVSRGCALYGIETLGFQNVFGIRKPQTTAGNGIFRHRRAIDWAFVSGPVEVASAQVHSDVDASDHHPISFTLRLLPDECRSDA